MFLFFDILLTDCIVFTCSILLEILYLGLDNQSTFKDVVRYCHGSNK